MIANGYNYIIGTQTIGAKYKFTDKPVLVETSDRILEMGSNILKIALNPVEADVEQAEFKHASPLQLITESEVIKEVLAKDFRYIFMWVTTPGVKWADGMDEDDILEAYGSNIYLSINEEISLKDLVYGLMLRSGNDASIAISSYVSNSTKEFVELMKKYNVKRCYYGHLHGASINDAVQGNIEGIDFKLVSADGLDFNLLKI